MNRWASVAAGKDVEAPRSGAIRRIGCCGVGKWASQPAFVSNSSAAISVSSACVFACDCPG